MEATPRLLAHYHEHVRPKMTELFGYSNPMQVPSITKVKVNVGVGEANKNQKLLDSVVEELGLITGQQAVVTRARWETTEATVKSPTVAQLGQSLLTDYLVPFEAMSVMLLVVMIGAALMARQD